jgi:DNA-binding response OmpR family regulator
LWHCLIASARPAHRQWLAEAGRQWGWNVSVCGTSADAQRSVRRRHPQLAIVDLHRPEGEAFCALVEQIASECKTLLVICGNEEDGQEEIWVRELGTWFYLPGMQPGASVALLFRDARTIVEKQAGQLLPGGPRGEVLWE